MVTQHYRWDFIGLSTDEKPTPATSEKVVDGSTFYCSDTSKLYVFYKDTWYERKALGGGGGGGGSYTAGTGIDITDDTISVDTTTIQEKLTAGTNVTISDNTISATDTTYSAFTGTDGTTAGSAGLVPAPATTDTDKYLKSDGTWATVSGGGSGPTVVQTAGTSQSDVMSQNAVTSMVFADPSTKQQIRIGTTQTAGASSTAVGNNSKASAQYSTAIGQAVWSEAVGAVAVGSDGTTADTAGSVAIGRGAYGHAEGAIALGAYSTASTTGEMNIGSSQATAGYNNSNYRLLTGLYDGQSAHDAATVAQAVGESESYTIATSDWSSLSNSDPYTYQTTVTATHTIGNNTVAELLNDSAVTFATYGFAIGSISGQSVTIYSIGQPSASVTLKINYKG